MQRVEARLKTLFLIVGLAFFTPTATGGPVDWANEFPITVLNERSINLTEIRSDGATRDPIPTINNPKLIAGAGVRDVGPLEPLISLVIDGDARAYLLPYIIVARDPQRHGWRRSRGHQLLPALQLDHRL